jgi:hypothetical protein
MNTRPTLTLILKGQAVGGCTSELVGSVSVAAPAVQNYTVALGTNVQYVTGTPPDFPNGLNVGPISFN